MYRFSYILNILYIITLPTKIIFYSKTNTLYTKADIVFIVMTTYGFFVHINSQDNMYIKVKLYLLQMSKSPLSATHVFE